MPPRKKLKSWSMYPALHDELLKELEEDDLYLTFNNNDDERGRIETYDTNIMGRFTCHNNNCTSRGWSSKKIAITIRMYNGDRYNARVYHQRCRSCNWLSRPDLDVDTYVDRVAYRLKKWSGVEVERPFYSRKIGKPHERALCEGCKNGHCKEGELWG
ncbi:uncharacterized protein NECHADRAFT_53170 [Fusarium vanettenii 77-13-4]|uniref:3CxxC-type domain-containing protein n=1 Tax=Fusarium vanettenii (strain ATCC MYA-4622 / CBS 123669 / FGSC 9596 / NRRL 45880 / 77-13-4) TaxID=660122 RepID=C7ZIM6_FUSV7|nr:uncharacterized protein NECHADRAFT_53170 [Fusarium vanettenii 77-13-4]EEU36114.1 hypothetical protein NECHADRAFT_53170 [Fusarium vanettenii 77-13-4]